MRTLYLIDNEIFNNKRIRDLNCVTYIRPKVPAIKLVLLPYGVYYTMEGVSLADFEKEICQTYLSSTILEDTVKGLYITYDDVPMIRDDMMLGMGSEIKIHKSTSIDIRDVPKELLGTNYYLQDSLIKSVVISDSVENEGCCCRPTLQDSIPTVPYFSIKSFLLSSASLIVRLRGLSSYARDLSKHFSEVMGSDLDLRRDLVNFPIPNIVKVWDRRNIEWNELMENVVSLNERRSSYQTSMYVIFELWKEIEYHRREFNYILKALAWEKYDAFEDSFNTYPFFEGGVYYITNLIKLLEELIVRDERFSNYPRLRIPHFDSFGNQIDSI